MNTPPLEQISDAIELPLIQARELVIFPHTLVPFLSDSPQTSVIINRAMTQDRLVFFAYPRAVQHEGFTSRYEPIGTVVKIIQVFKLKNNTIRLLGEALYRAELTSEQIAADDIPYARIRPIIHGPSDDQQLLLLMQSIKQAFTSYSTTTGNIPDELKQKITNADQGDLLVDLICSHMPLQADLRMELLQLVDTRERLQRLALLIDTEISLLDLKNEIQSNVKKRLEQAQKEYFLHEQIRQINKELGREQDESDEADELLKQIMAKNPPEEVARKAEKEANRLRRLQSASPESGVIRTYLEWLSDLPWDTLSQDNYDITRAQQILDEDHYNMIKPKDRILDFLAVRSIQQSIKGPILCLTGPPGTGKTSLGKSIARTMGREFIRVSLGGVRDEAEIRGHRKTYIGALPGKIIQSLKRAGTKNPVFLLDEIDKMSSDFRGDPASAMLEVLDPEQNSTFSDHYLEVPYDLSQVLFIATANSLHTIPAPLKDRMEIIEVPGYSDLEKYQIATGFLIPKQLKENGLGDSRVTFRKDAVMRIIHEYTMESGVRQLERTMASVMRKVARIYVAEHSRVDGVTGFTKAVTARQIPKLIGKPLYTQDLLHAHTAPGLAHGLAWTEMGGRILSVEAVLFPGTGKLILTGNLGEVMKESARISLSYIQSHALELSIDPKRISEHDIHIHVPQGAIPKDGPSAGITLTVALYSALAGVSVPSDVSMTGEMTLTGTILPIGGVKEKVLASYRHGIKRILLPVQNESHARDDIPDSVRADLQLYYMERIEDALRLLFPKQCAHDE
jgi:ATP-dependent Lon protease